MFVIKEPKNYSYDKAGAKGKIFPINNLTQKTQFVLVETEYGHQTVVLEREIDKLYYIIDGDGYFEINGSRENCTAGDLVVIPAGNKYTFKGKMKMLLNCTPPWFEAQEETIG
jgi:mannose-6-phosphate isomerase-like protein (cupin superfamily)